jgi:hypothetical protein
VRLLFGVALVWLSLVIYLHLAWVPLCVSHHGRMTVCSDGDESCPVFIVDYIDARCTRALTLWAMDRPQAGPMWEIWWDEAETSMLRLTPWPPDSPTPFMKGGLRFQVNAKGERLGGRGLMLEDIDSLDHGLNLVTFVSPHVDRENPDRLLISANHSQACKL